MSTFTTQHRGPVLSPVREAAHRLVVLANAVRLGHGASDQAISWANQFADQILDFIKHERSLALEVDNEALWCAGTELTAGNQMSRRLLAGLFEQGLTIIYIEHTAIRSELIGLANLLAQDWSAHDENSLDLRHQAWAIGFESVFLDIAGDMANADAPEAQHDQVAFLAAMASEAVGQNHKNARSSQPVLQDSIQALINTLTNAGPQSSPDDEASEEELDAIWISQEHQALQIQLDQIRNDTDESDEATGNVIFETIRNGFRCSNKSDNAVTRNLSAEVAARVVELAQQEIRLGNPTGALALLRPTILLCGGNHFEDWALRRSVKKEISKLVDMELIDAIESGLKLEPDTTIWASIMFTLAQLSSDVNRICRVGAGMQSRELREAFADAAYIVAGQQELTPMRLLRQTTPTELPIALLALRRCADPILIEPILSHVSNANAITRESALVALRNQQSARAKEVVQKAMSDTDEPVRVEALRYLTVYRVMDAAPVMLHRLKTLRVPQCSATEFRALAMAYARIIGPEAVSSLSSISSAGSSMHDPDAVRGALHGLMTLGPPGREALELLGRKHPELRRPIRSLLGGTL